MWPCQAGQAGESGLMTGGRSGIYLLSPRERIERIENVSRTSSGSNASALGGVERRGSAFKLHTGGRDGSAVGRSSSDVIAMGAFSAIVMRFAKN